MLDGTHVLSELMRPSPAPQVLDWFAAQTPNQLHTSVVTYAEVLAGIALLAAGKRREQGKRRPTGAAKALLKVLDKAPEAALAALH